MKWIKFFLSHSLFISLCAVALCYQTYLLLHIRADNRIFLFIFFATLSSYNFYWLVSKFSFNTYKSIPHFVKSNSSYFVIWFLAGIGLFIMAWQLPYLWPYIVVAIVLTLIYSMPLWPFKWVIVLRRAGFLKTTLLSFTWAYVTVIFPAVPVLFTDIYAVSALFVARFFFMLLLCTIFDKRDVEADKLHSLHSLATDIKLSTLHFIMAVVFLGYLISGFWLRSHLKDDGQMLAFFITGILVAWAYLASLKKQGYVFYYFLIDGLMLVSALGTWLAYIW